MLRAHRAIEVADLDELTEVLAVCQGNRLPRGRRLAVVTASGGQAELILDVASASGVELPPLPAAARDEVARVIGAITGDGNPLDAWGNGDYTTPAGYTLPTNITVTGTYQWNAVYSGDGKNAPDSAINDPAERVVVSPASPALNTTPGATVLKNLGFTAENVTERALRLVERFSAVRG